MALGIQVLSSLTANQVIFDFTATAESLRFSTNRHGFADCSLTVPLSQADAFRLYDLAGAVFLRVSDNGLTAWEGRLEDVRVINGGAALKALGCWRAMYDAPYSGTFSQTITTEWKPILETDITGRNPKMFEFDTQGRLFTGISKGAVYQSGGGSDAFSFYLPQPSQSSLDWIGLDFTYELYAPTNWRAAAIGYNDGWANVVALGWTLDAAGSVQTATCALTFSGSARDIVVFSFFNNTGSASSPAGENGAYYLKLTGVRAKGTTSAALYADEIADALVAYVNGLNSTQLNSSAALIESPGVDLKDEVYEDQYPADILDRLAFIGDTSGSPYEVGVWEDQQLHFRQRGKYGRSWYVDIADLDVERSAGDVWNSAYSVYQEASGRNLRTATSSASDSIAVFGMTRRQAVRVTTTGSAQAEYARNTYLTDNKNSKPRVSLTIEALYDATGAEHPVWTARSGDTIVIRNLPPTVSQQIDKITSFRLDETEYDARSNSNRLVPESPPPALDVLVARQGVGL